MTNEEISKRVADAIFRPFSGNSDDFAIQLFVERVAIPSFVKEYDLKQLESYVRDALERGMAYREADNNDNPL